MTRAFFAVTLAASVAGAWAKSTGRVASLTAASGDPVALAHLAAGGLALALACTRRASVGALAVLVVLAGVRPLPWAPLETLPGFALPVLHAVCGFALLAAALLAAMQGRTAEGAAPCGAHPLAHKRFALIANALLGFTLLQVLLGALTRHSGAGLSIPDFPLAMGKLIPPLVSPYVLVHFLHRVVGMSVVTLAIVLSGIASVDLADHPLPGTVARMLAVVTSLQVGLGAYVIWWERAPGVTTAHVANGALALGLAVWLAAMGRGFRAQR